VLYAFDLLFHDEHQFTRRLESVPQKKNLGMTKQIHDFNLLSKLVPLRRSHADEFRRESLAAAQLRAQADAAELASVTYAEKVLCYNRQCDNYNQ